MTLLPAARRERVTFAATLILLIVCAGLFAARQLAAKDTVPGPSAEERAAIEAGYVCPMDPQIVSDHPGRCPICGMELVRAGGSGRTHGHAVEGGALASLGVHVVEVERKPVAQVLRSWGTVVPDESSLYQVTTKFDGWVRKLAVHSVGERIQKGQELYEIYSPDLVMKEREYFQFLVRRKQVLQAVGDVSQQENEYVMDLLRDSQKEREDFLRRDLDIDTVLQLERTGTTIEVVKVHAQRGGVVTQLNAREGGFVSPATPVMVIADPQAVWVDVALAQGQFDRVRRGDAVTITGSDGEPVHGTVDFISPLQDGSRGHARVALPGGAPALRLGGIVDVDIRTAAHEGRVIPSSALLRTGHGSFVMLARDKGVFVPVEVTPVLETEDEVEIGGLQVGAKIASNAQFLLDPAASTSDARDRLDPAVASAAH